MRETVAALAAVRGANRCRTIAALLETDIAVRRAVVACADLELDPCGWEVRAALDATFEAFGEADEGGLVGAEFGGFEGVVEVCAGGAVAVPVVVEEEVLLFFARFVA